MTILSIILIALIALLHLYIAWFEMFSWEVRGPKIFISFPRDMFPKTKAMAANQGVYSGFLAAGLIWSLVIGDPAWSRNVATFFLLCVVIAGLYGAVSVTRRTLYIQSGPACLALIARWLP